MSLINQLVVVCSLGSVVRVGSLRMGRSAGKLYVELAALTVSFAVALSSNSREAPRHAQREVSVGFLCEAESILHACCCLGKLEYL